MLKLNLGAGATPLLDFENLDHKTGQEVYPLAYDDNAADVIRASHVLEHFGHHEVSKVLADWVRVLKPGGILQVAVPDFAKIAQAYVDGEELPVQGYVMGGQVDADDFHKCIFDVNALAEEMTSAGLVDIKGWKSDVNDCAALPISLNLQGRKPDPAKQTAQQPDEFAERCRKIGASMSMPRLSFTDNYFCAFEGLVPLGIRLRKQTGAFWGQSLERSIDQWIADGAEWILTMDYDTVFTKDDVAELVRLSLKYPNADAIAPIQAHRTKATPLMTIRGEDGANEGYIKMAAFKPDLMPVATAHFGLTLLNVEKIKQMPRPWFWSKPNTSGQWGEGREDDDIYFWRRWEEVGNTLFLANHVTVGHAELMVRWPNKHLAADYQHPTDFWLDGKPDWCWE